MNNSSSTNQILAPIWRRKWLILAVGLVVAVGSYVYYKRQPAVFSAITTLNLAAGEEGAGSSSTGSGKAASKLTVANAAAVIASAETKHAAAEIIRKEGNGKAIKGKVKVKTAGTGGTVIQIYAEAIGAKRAARLANAYAVAYINNYNRRYRIGIERQIDDRRRQLSRLEAASSSVVSAAEGGQKTKGAKGGKSSATGGAALIQEASLASQITQLESELHIQGIAQITPATAKTAELLEPMPKQNAIFGFLLGVVIAILIAFGLEALDRSLRNIDDAEEVLGGKLLAALPRVSRPVREEGGAPVLSPSIDDGARRANATLEAIEPAGESAGGTLLFTSPDSGDGKSTLVAALAIVKAQAGQRVAIVETDFEHPSQGRLLCVGDDVGLVDVLTGALPLLDVIKRVPMHQFADQTVPVMAGAPAQPPAGAGFISAVVGRPAEHPPSLAAPAFANLLKSLADTHDVVLVDAETELDAADTIAAMRLVDGIVVVGRIGASGDASVERLEEVLSLPNVAPVIGTVANCARDADLEAHGFRGAKTRRGRSARKRSGR